MHPCGGPCTTTDTDNYLYPISPFPTDHQQKLNYATSPCCDVALAQLAVRVTAPAFDVEVIQEYASEFNSRVNGRNLGFHSRFEPWSYTKPQGSIKIEEKNTKNHPAADLIPTSTVGRASPISEV